MSYFSLKKRTIPQIFLIIIGIYGFLNVLFSILKFGVRDPYEIVVLILFLGCIWSGTSPAKKEEKLDKEEHFEDILDK